MVLMVVPGNAIYAYIDHPKFVCFCDIYTLHEVVAHIAYLEFRRARSRRSVRHVTSINKTSIYRDNGSISPDSWRCVNWNTCNDFEVIANFRIGVTRIAITVLNEHGQLQEFLRGLDNSKDVIIYRTSNTG